MADMHNIYSRVSRRGPDGDRRNAPAWPAGCRVRSNSWASYLPLSGTEPNHLAMSLSNVPSLFMARRCWLISAMRSLSSCLVLIPTIRLSHTLEIRIEGILRMA